MSTGVERNPRIPLAVPSFGEREVAAVTEAVRSGWVSSASPATTQFEEQFAALLGMPRAVAVVNGTTALQLALIVAGVQPGDDVLLPALTFVAPANAVRHVGAHPVFLDVDAATAQLDGDRASAYLRERYRRTADGCINRTTRRRLGAVLPVHILGHACPLLPLVDAARELDVPVVEDATEGLGATLAGRPLGCLGDIGCFSFNGNKLLTSGGGGMAVTARADWADRMRYLSLQAKNPGLEYVHGEVGFNARMTGLSAALGLAQLASFDTHLAAKRRIAARYVDGLRDTPGIGHVAPAAGVDSAWWLFTLLVDERQAGLDSRALIARLDERGIESRPLWQPLPASPAFAGCDAESWPHAAALCRDGLSIPSSVALGSEEQDRVVRAVQDAVGAARA